VQKVLSTSSGTPACREIPATAAMSVSTSVGFAGDSTYTRRVFRVIARAKFRGSRASTSVTVMPSFGRVCVKSWCVPP